MDHTCPVDDELPLGADGGQLRFVCLRLTGVISLMCDHARVFGPHPDRLLGAPPGRPPPLIPLTVPHHPSMEMGLSPRLRQLGPEVVEEVGSKWRSLQAMHLLRCWCGCLPAHCLLIVSSLAYVKHACGTKGGNGLPAFT